MRSADVPVADHLPNDTSQTDPDLTEVGSAWPELPAAARAEILAKVRSARARGRDAP
jgi:hypothetical protein